MDEVKAPGKSFDISKEEVWAAWVKVRGNQGAAGVDGVSVEAFEKDLRNNLYRIWNRMSSGTYFPPDVKAVARQMPWRARCRETSTADSASGVGNGPGAIPAPSASPRGGVSAAFRSSEGGVLVADRAQRL
jgi:hypothetical protein